MQSIVYVSSFSPQTIAFRIELELDVRYMYHYRKHFSVICEAFLNYSYKISKSKSYNMHKRSKCYMDREESKSRFIFNQIYPVKQTWCYWTKINTCSCIESLVCGSLLLHLGSYLFQLSPRFQQ